jgi:hypothetical protein
VRTKLGRNKTDGVDASHIREYCELFKPSPWAPPSEAHRRLGEWPMRRSRTSRASSERSTKPSH